MIILFNLYVVFKDPVQQPMSNIAEKARKERWSLWSLHGGLHTLVNKLSSALVDQGVHIRTNTPCTSVSLSSNGQSIVQLGTDDLTVDHVISSLPSASLSKVLSSNHKQLAALLQRIQSVTVAVVNVEFEGHVLPVEGFGFLVPSSEPLPILGVIFDSCCFPHLDRKKGSTTRLTVRMYKIEFSYGILCLISNLVIKLTEQKALSLNVSDKRPIISTLSNTFLQCCPVLLVCKSLNMDKNGDLKKTAKALTIVVSK